MGLLAGLRLLLSALQVRCQFIDAPDGRQDKDRHKSHRPKEHHSVVEVVLASVIAKDWKNNQCHLIGQMVSNGEPLHARGQTDEVHLGIGLDILADSLATFPVFRAFMF